MKVQYRTGAATVEVDGKDSKDCFAQIAAAVEVFRYSQCGACGSPEIFPQVRENDGNTYYEIKCNACRAELSFGQRKVGGALFPKKKDKDGKWLDNGGWVRWQPKVADAPF